MVPAAAGRVSYAFWQMAACARSRDTPGMDTAPPPFPFEIQPFDPPTGAARAALEAVLIESIERRKEFGGMICQWGTKYFAMPPREGDTNTVDVGHRGGNKGCPEGTSAVAYYHTHPAVKGAGFKMEPNKFSPEDRGVADDFGIDAYVGSVSGLFLKYDHRTKKTAVAGPRLKNCRDEMILRDPPRVTPRSRTRARLNAT